MDWLLELLVGVALEFDDEDERVGCGRGRLFALMRAESGAGGSRMIRGRSFARLELSCRGAGRVASRRREAERDDVDASDKERS